MAGANQIAEAKNNHADSQTVQANVDSFKITEIGSVPTDWQVISIEDALRSGAILDQMDGNHGELYPKSHEFSSFGIPYIGATDFDSGRVNYKTCKFIPEKRAKKFRKGIAKNGDVLFAHNATVGPVALLKTDLEYVILSTTATYYRCNLKVLNNYYLSKFFESSFFVDQYTSVMSQSTRNQVPILAQRKFFIAVPGIEEQTAIANALSDVDALIGELEKLIAKKQAIKTATMQQLLTGRTRLPAFAHHPSGTKKGYKQTELGEIPEDWEVISMGEIGSTFGGLSGKGKGDFGSGNSLYVPFTNVMANVVVDVERLDRVEVNEAQNNVRQGDLLFNGSSETPEEVCFCSLMLEEIDDLYLNSFCFGFRSNPTSKYSPLYLAYWFRSVIGRSAVSVMAQGSTRYNISKSQFLKLGIVLPSKDEQAVIATTLSDMDTELQSLAQRLSKTRQIKQGMMQELLTGRTRLV
jgi:type I restriction enzyme S subunit